MSSEILKNIPKNIAGARTSFKRGEMVYTLSDRGAFVHILISGKTICQMDKVDGSFMPICVYEPYSLFGEVEIFSPDAESAYIEALTDCVTVRIDRLNFLKWLKQDFDFSVFIMKQLSDKLLGQSKRTAEFVMLSVKDRVLAVMENYHRNDCLDQLTKEKLCCGVSAPLRSVNRALRLLTEEGRIAYRQKRFCWLDSRLP